MRLSTRSRYGLRLMFDLALYYGEGPVFLKDSARRQSISEKYLSKLVIPLRGARLIFSERGAHGGYALARPPYQITAWDIVSALEGDLAPVECVKDRNVCTFSELCPSRDVWVGLEGAIRRYLEGITLESLLVNSEEKLMTYQI